MMNNQVSIEKYLDQDYILYNEDIYYIKYDSYYNIFDVYSKLGGKFEGNVNIKTLIEYIKRNKEYNKKLIDELIELFPEYMI